MCHPDRRSEVARRLYMSSRPKEQSDEVEGSVRLATLAQDKPMGWLT